MTARLENLLAQEFTADAAPQLSARVGMALRRGRLVHATAFLQALAHRVQVTVRDHDLSHPDLANTHKGSLVPRRSLQQSIQQFKKKKKIFPIQKKSLV